MKYGVWDNRDSRIYLLVVGVATAVLAGLLGWWGFTQYRASQNQRAQLLFSELVQRFDELRFAEQASADAWQDVATACEQGYRLHSSSSLAPYFLAFQADALINSGDTDSGQEVLGRALDLIPKSNTLYPLYAIKHAVLQLSVPFRGSPDVLGAPHPDAGREQGRRALLAIAQDSRSSGQGLAWYHLWYYAYDTNDAELLKTARLKLQAYPVYNYEIQSIAGSDKEA